MNDIESKFIRKFDLDKMNDIEKLFNVESNHPLYLYIRKSKYNFYNIKHCNKDINKMTYMSLTQLYVSILYYFNKRLLKNFSSKYISYSYEYDQYTNRFCDKHQRFDILMYIDGNYKSSKRMLDIIIKNKPYEIKLEDIEQYKKTINEIKHEISDIYSSVDDLLNNKSEDYIIISNIINIYQTKTDLMYRFISKFNNPEMIIYNFIVKKMEENKQILNIFTRFTLPVKRAESKSPLYADLLVVLNFEDDYHFIVIEYDGPTHDNIDDFRFVDSIVLCDITKNKFCINNNISLIRLNYKINMNEHLNTINEIINHIFACKKPIYHNIPSDEYYEELLIKYNNECVL